MPTRTLYEEIAGEGRPGGSPGGEEAWRARVAVVLDTLSPREAFIIRERYLSERRATFSELAAAYEVSAKRMSQIGLRALRKLRHPSRRRFLLRQGDLTAPAWSRHPGWWPPAVPPPPVFRADLPLRDRLLIEVRDLEISVRAFNCMEAAKVRFIGDLVHKTETELLHVKNLGRKTLKEIKAFLTGLDLTLGMKVNGWARMRARKLRPSGEPVEQERQNNGGKTLREIRAILAELNASL